MTGDGNVYTTVRSINPSRLAFGVADIYLAGQIKEPAKDETAAKKPTRVAVPKA